MTGHQHALPSSSSSSHGEGVSPPPERPQLGREEKRGPGGGHDGGRKGGEGHGVGVRGDGRGRQGGHDEVTHTPTIGTHQSPKEALKRMKKAAEAATKAADRAKEAADRAKEAAAKAREKTRLYEEKHWGKGGRDGGRADKEGHDQL